MKGHFILNLQYRCIDLLNSSFRLQPFYLIHKLNNLEFNLSFKLRFCHITVMILLKIQKNSLAKLSLYFYSQI